MTELVPPITCYSQYGEDVLAHHILSALGVRAGGYMDVGCGHPVEFNNTYLFYLAGWRGVHVDPDPSFQPLYQQVRPGDDFLCAAVGSGCQAIRYYRFSPYYYSTCEKTRADLLMQDPAVKYLGAAEVRGCPLSVVLAEYAAAHPEFSLDLMSVDVEGLELEVLISNDWAKFRPKVLIMEILGLQAANGLLRTPAYRLLREMGYSLKAMTQNSFVFADCTLENFSRYPELPLGPVTVLD